MCIRQFSIALLSLFCYFLLIPRGYAQETTSDQQIGVSLRMLGHEVLLSAKDSTSRVLPILKEEDRYRIQFESEFEFIPEDLVSTIDRVVKETGLAKRYIVEVEQCETGEVVYSFKMDDVAQSDIVPCRSRVQHKACYSLLITIVEGGRALLAENPDSSNGSKAATDLVKNIAIGFLLLLAALLFYFQWKRRNKAVNDPNLISLGEYQFDKRNTELVIEQQRIELTSKEADLLLLLYDAANTT
ncbi:MAG: DNA-binding response regulator, partial [Bacteroidia bacterium]|nr:DNA-binding response regulator [Bacteroidia bacterium]